MLKIPKIICRDGRNKDQNWQIAREATKKNRERKTKYDT
jgi:hypothetical protein